MEGLCKTCKHCVYCTYCHNRTARWCEEYDHIAAAPQYDWDLKEFSRLFSETKVDKKQDDG